MSMQKRRAVWSSFKFTEWLQNERKGEKAMIRNLYNQVPHLTQDTDGISDKVSKVAKIRNRYNQVPNARKQHIPENQEASTFPTGDHKVA